MNNEAQAAPAASSARLNERTAQRAIVAPAVQGSHYAPGEAHRIGRLFGSNAPLFARSAARTVTGRTITK